MGTPFEDANSVVSSWQSLENAQIGDGDSLLVARDGAVQSAVIECGGTMALCAGANVQDVCVVSGGMLWIEPGCTTPNAEIIAGGRINGMRMARWAGLDSGSKFELGTVYIDNGFSAYLGAGQSADTCRVSSGGNLDVKPGASVATTMMLYSGGKLNGFTAERVLRYYSFEGNSLVISGLTVHDGDLGICYAGQSVKDCSVLSGGTLKVTEGGTYYANYGYSLAGNVEVSGQLVVSSGADVAGCDLDIRLDELDKANSTAIVSGLERLSNEFTVTVDAFQASGKYVLADKLGGSYFCSISLVCSDGADIGTLALEAGLYSVNYSYGTYALSLSSGKLTLDVSQAYPSTHPAITARQDGLKMYVSALDACCVKGFVYRYSDDDEWIDCSNGEISLKPDAGNIQFRAVNITGAEKSITLELDPEKTETKAVLLAFGDENDDLAVSIGRGNETQKMLSCSEGLFSVTNIGNDVIVQAEDSDGNAFLGDGIAVEAAEISEEPASITAGESDGVADVFAVRTDGVWTNEYSAQHVGYLKNGEIIGVSGDVVPLAGRNCITDIFSGAEGDACVLLLTDDANGDALFVEDIYSESCLDAGKVQSRLANISEICAGAGDDVLDMTSDCFEYIGSGIVFHGGEGNDVIWTNGGNNMLFGDAGNDLLVGGCDDDVFVGGTGDDVMKGNGGDDIFCFGAGWGHDEVFQLAGGKVILWFAEGTDGAWDDSNRTYTSGSDAVSVCAGVEVDIRIGAAGGADYSRLLAAGAFA